MLEGLWSTHACADGCFLPFEARDEEVPQTGWVEGRKKNYGPGLLWVEKLLLLLNLI